MDKIQGAFITLDLHCGWMCLFFGVYSPYNVLSMFRPFRAYNQVDDKESWGRVTSLERGRVYQQVIIGVYFKCYFEQLLQFFIC